MEMGVGLEESRHAEHCAKLFSCLRGNLVGDHRNILIFFEIKSFFFSLTIFMHKRKKHSEVLPEI